NKVIQPHLTIMDSSNFFKERVLIAGDNTYEIDHFVAKQIGIERPEYLNTSREIGVGSDDFTISGDNTGQVRKQYEYVPREYKQFLRLRLWSNPRACSMCRFVFLNLKGFSNDDLRYSTTMKIKLLKYAITGAEIVFGSKPTFKHEYKNVICIGNCTKKLAKENGYIHIPGCPPTKDQIFKYL
ncbi:unnamed protein product, partial [marine sediment metagenome]